MNADVAIAIVGQTNGSHMAGSLYRAAQKLDLQTELFDQETAKSRFAIINSLAWRALDKRAPSAGRLYKALLWYVQSKERSIIITTGLCPINHATLSACRRLGAICLHFSSDDPWNPGQSAKWHHRALGAYDVVFTPRRSNIGDLERLCPRVRYLPFAYDSDLVALAREAPLTARPEALFVGGGDPDRADFFRRYLRAEAPITFVGGYWDRYQELRHFSLGLKSPEEVGGLTRAAAVNLCLVRRANRDGHVMRTFEIAALGGCMAVEDTHEHREIFGAEGEAVVYFRSPEEAADRVKSLLGKPNERRRLARVVHEKIVGGSNTYADRLKTMLVEVGARVGQVA